MLPLFPTHPSQLVLWSLAHCATFQLASGQSSFLLRVAEDTERHKRAIYQRNGLLTSGVCPHIVLNALLKDIRNFLQTKVDDLSAQRG